MPCLSNRYNPSIGPIIKVGILPAGSFDPANPLPNFPQFSALIDTGASATCISPVVVSAASLQSIGMRPMISATETMPVNAYLVDMLLPFGGAGFVIKDAQVMEFISETQNYEILVGRDIICKGALTISFDGHFTFCL